MKKCKNIIKVVMLFAIVLVMGCVEKFEANIGDIPVEGLVVEGDIISDSTVVFQLSKTLPLNENEEYADLFEDYMNVDAKLQVKGSDGTSWLGFGLGKGQYRVDIGTLRPDVEYHLEILYDNETYQSKAQLPLATTGIEKLAFSQPDLMGPVTIFLNTQDSNSDEAEYFLWYYEEDWEIRSDFATTALYHPELNSIIHYGYVPVAQGWCYNKNSRIMLGTTEANVKNQIVGKTIQSIKNTDHRLSFLYSIRVQQRNLTRQEYEYYQVRAKLNNEMGGLFTPQPSELPTNIICSNPSRKVIGYVGCNMGVSKRQLYIKEEDVCYLDIYRCDMGKDPDGSPRVKYEAGFQISDVTPIGVEWARKECVDVRTKNADPRGRPSWWPNPYKYLTEEQGVE